MASFFSGSSIAVPRCAEPTHRKRTVNLDDLELVNGERSELDANRPSHFSDDLMTHAILAQQASDAIETSLGPPISSIT